MQSSSSSARYPQTRTILYTFGYVDLSRSSRGPRFGAIGVMRQEQETEIESETPSQRQSHAHGLRRMAREKRQDTTDQMDVGERLLARERSANGEKQLLAGQGS